MSSQYDKLRAEMEVNPMLQNVIAAHHMIQMASLFVGVIFCVATSQWLLMKINLTLIMPAWVCVLFLIASKCNFHDLRLILVHFNFILCMLWFIAIFPLFVVSIIMPERGNGGYNSNKRNLAPIIVAIVNGFLCFSSVCFAVCAMWKSARRVVLNSKLTKLQYPVRHVKYSNDHNDIQDSQVPYVLLT